MIMGDGNFGKILIEDIKERANIKPIAVEDLKIGDAIDVDIDVSKHGCTIRKTFLFPIGVVKRNIKKGEVVDYDPLGNTKDVHTRKESND